MIPSSNAPVTIEDLQQQEYLRNRISANYRKIVSFYLKNIIGLNATTVIVIMLALVAKTSNPIQSILLDFKLTTPPDTVSRLSKPLLGVFVLLNLLSCSSSMIVQCQFKKPDKEINFNSLELHMMLICLGCMLDIPLCLAYLEFYWRTYSDLRHLVLIGFGCLHLLSFSLAVLFHCRHNNKALEFFKELQEAGIGGEVAIPSLSQESSVFGLELSSGRDIGTRGGGYQYTQVSSSDSSAREPKSSEIGSNQEKIVSGHQIRGTTGKKFKYRKSII